MRRRHFPEGTLIFSEGDPSREAYVLRSGRVEVIKATPRGPLRLAVLGPGDVLGEMGLLDDRLRSASARTLEEVEADAVSADEFTDLLTTKPSQSMEILHSLFERLRSANQRLSEVTANPATLAPIPRVRIAPLTPETATALPADGLAVLRFPFRVGRLPDPGEDLGFGMNEVEVRDHAPHLLSRYHFALDLATGGLVVRDRGSTHGTSVNGEAIGATAMHDFVPLRPGDNEVVAGALHLPRERRVSPFRFLVVAE